LCIKARGYAAATLGAIAEASRRFVIIGDSDVSYDFSQLMPFVEALRTGADLVRGSRFRGGIEPGAMPVLHKYLGNPMPSFLSDSSFTIKMATSIEPGEVSFATACA
jgi:hypothetical protein